jgi:putative hemolysin
MIVNLIYIGVIAVSVAAVAFFGGSEIAFVSSNRFRIRGMARRGVRGAPTARWLLEHPSTLLSATLVGTNIFLVLASSLTTRMLGPALGPYTVPVSTLVITVTVLILGEIVPKTLARTRPEAFLTRVAPGLGVSYYLLYPIARGTSAIALALMRLARADHRGSQVTRDEIRALVKETAQAGTGIPSQTYAHRVLDLSRMKITSVMLPMDEVVAVEENATIREVLEIAASRGHSRYPVYKRSPDHVVGVLHLKDLLGAPPDSKIKVFVHSAYFVPETKSVKRAISEMRDELRHLGVVTDEYGRPIGILTFEDLIEEIMGEISDEYDRPEASSIRLGRVISGGTPISLLSEELDLDIPAGSYDTVAGFILDRAGRICEAGDTVRYKGLEFHVVEVRGKRIRRVRITRSED